MGHSDSFISLLSSYYCIFRSCGCLFNVVLVFLTVFSSLSGKPVIYYTYVGVTGDETSRPFFLLLITQWMDTINVSVCF